MSDATMTPDEVRAVVERLRTRIDATGQAWVPMLVNHPTSSFAASDDIRALCTAALAALDAVARVRAMHVIDRGRDPWSGKPYCVCSQCGRQDDDATECPTLRALDAQEADRD